MEPQQCDFDEAGRVALEDARFVENLISGLPGHTTIVPYSEGMASIEDGVDHIVLEEAASEEVQNLYENGYLEWTGKEFRAWSV